MTRPPRILVVDDEVLNRCLIEAILAPAGYAIVHATDGQSALAEIARGDIALVLLDVMMPGIDGIEVCRRIRTELALPILPVVVVSALTDVASRTRAKAAGADDFLTKPIHEDELLVRVRNLLLVREYYALAEQQRARAEAEAGAWKLVSRVAETVAGALEYQQVTDAVVDALSSTLAIDLALVVDGTPPAVAAMTPAASLTLCGAPSAELAALAARRVLAPGTAPAELAPLFDAHAVAELVALPIRIGGEARGVFCLGRHTPFAAGELELLDALSPHLANAIATVRSHTRTVMRSRKIEEQLRQAQKMEAIGRLAGGVAHDFNNLLAAILGSTELALDELPAAHPARMDLEEVVAAAHRAAVLTRQLLAFSRQQPREVRVLALNSVVTNVEKMLARIVGEDIVMKAVLAPELGAVAADAGQIEQVLVNLVVNARDAMPAGGRLTIETANVTLEHEHAQRLEVASGDYVVLAVSDTGCGIEPAIQARVFEPFFTTKDVGKGTGLGLATVFGIVKQSGGAIAVYSEPGKGSTFRVYLPRHDRAAAQAERPGPTSPIRAIGSERVLLVEDDDQLRAVIARQLVSWGYRVYAADCGTSALAMLERMREPIDLVLTDLVMPGLDGRAFASRVLVARPHTKVLFMSGYSEHAAVTTAALGDGDHFLAKPFTASALSSAIQRALGSRVTTAARAE